MDFTQKIERVKVLLVEREKIDVELQQLMGSSPAAEPVRGKRIKVSAPGEGGKKDHFPCGECNKIGKHKRKCSQHPKNVAGGGATSKEPAASGEGNERKLRIESALISGSSVQDIARDEEVSDQYVYIIKARLKRDGRL